jgi:Fe-S-cluster containining protein
VSQDRCTGGCCKEFYMQSSLEELKRDYDRHMAGEDHRFDEIEIIYPMLICQDELGDSDGNPLGSRSGHRYSCKNLLPNGDCGIYENRPHMCRQFPNNKECGRSDCTWSLGQLGLWPGIVPLKLNGEVDL